MEYWAQWSLKQREFTLFLFPAVASLLLKLPIYLAVGELLLNLAFAEEKAMKA